MESTTDIHRKALRVKAESIEILPEEPFKYDALSRQESAKRLTEFVGNANEPLVMSIDAAWGQGKSTFLRMWKCELENAGFPTLYFNAWENDFADDALIAMIGEMSSSLDELVARSARSKAKRNLAKAKRLAIALLKSSAPVGAKVLTVNMLDADKMVEQFVAAYAEERVKEQIEKYEKGKKSLQNFRGALEEFASSLQRSGEAVKPLVFIIDELDRCRPLFAIEVLERAKHLFSVNGIVFVLATDKQQLGHSIRCVYGQNMYVDGYLRRFIDFDFQLPEPSKGAYTGALFRRFGLELYSKNCGVPRRRSEIDECEFAMKEFSVMYQLSLREQEHAVAALSVAIKSSDENHNLYSLYLMFLIVLRIKCNDYYRRLVSNEVTLEEMLELIRSLRGGKQFLEERHGARLEAFLAGNTGSKEGRRALIKRYMDVSEDTSVSEDERDRGRWISSVLSRGSIEGLCNLQQLVKKIEFAWQFNWD